MGAGCAGGVLCGLLHSWLVWQYQELYGGDSVIHIRNRGHLFLAHQLPALQVLLFVAGKLTSGPTGWHVIMAALNAGAAVSFYLLATVILREPYAFATALLFVTNPFLNEISMVPFSEILMLGALCLGLWSHSRQRFLLCSLALASACFTRYEAWIACPLLAVEYFARSERKIRNFAQAVAMFCWAPLFWVGLHSGLSNPGSPVIEIPRSALRIVRWMYLAWITAKTTPIVVLAFAVPGAWLTFRKGSLGSVRRLIVRFYAIFFLSILFSAHGDSHGGSASPDLFVSSREATVLVAGVLLLAGLGMEALARRPRIQKLVPAGAALALCLGTAQSTLFIRTQVSPANVQLSFRLARYLDSHVRFGETALIIARPFSDVELRGYRTTGDHLKNTQNTMVDLSPMDFQRTAVQCRIPWDRLQSSPERSNAAWIAVWSDAPLSPEMKLRLAHRRRAESLMRPGLSVLIYR